MPRLQRVALSRGSIHDLLVRWLQRAVVFQLPDNGQLFENRDYRPELADLVRLPYPLMAIEFQADDTLFTPESGLTRADKRIALAFSPAALPADELALLCSITRSTDWQTAHPDALGLMAIYAPNAPEHPLLAWGFAPGFLLWDPVLDKPLDSPGAPPDMPDWARSRRLSEHSLPVGIYPLVARQHRLGLTNEMVRNSTLADSVDELGILPIDHIMTTRDWAAIDSGVGPDVGSDHRPVWARLVSLRAFEQPRDCEVRLGEPTRSAPCGAP